MKRKWRLPKPDAAELISILVMACAVALPALLWQLQSALSQSLEQRGSGAVVVFLGAAQEASPSDIEHWRQHELVAEVEALSARQAAQSFADFLGLSEADRAQLPTNLVPATVSLRLEPQADPYQVEAAISDWSNRSGVESIWWDRASLERSQQLYFSLRNLGRGLTLVLLLAGIGIVAADVSARLARSWKHIQVQTLLGATDEFILRPYVGRALLLGLAAGLISLGLLAVGMAALHSVLGDLARSWGQTIALRFPGASTSLLLMLAPASLSSITTAWVVLSRLHQPSVGRLS